MVRVTILIIVRRAGDGDVLVSLRMPACFFSHLLVLMEGRVVLIGAMPLALLGRWCWVESSTPLSVSANIDVMSMNFRK